MPRFKGDGYGDLYVRVRVVLPTDLDRRGEGRRASVPRRSSTSPTRGPDLPTTDSETRPMQLDHFTEKAQEAIVAAQQLAERLESPVLDAEHLLAALVEPDDGVPAETLRRLGVDLPGVPRRARRDPRASAPGSRAARCRSTRAPSASSSAPRRRPAGSATSTSRPSTSCSASPRSAARASELLERHGAGQRGSPRRAPERPRRPARDLAEPRGHVPGPREVRPRPDRRGAGRQARPGHRPRRRDPPRRSRSCRGGRRTTRS